MRLESTQLFQKLQKRYEEFCPYGKARLEKLVKQDFQRIVRLLAAAALLLVYWNLRFAFLSIGYLLGSIVLAFGIIVTEVPDYGLGKLKNSFSREYISYLSRVKHFYIREKNIPNAVMEAAEELSEELRLHAALLHQILSGSNRKEKVRNYVLSTNYSQYLKLFLVQAYEASEKGDIQEKESSLFSENLEYLRMEVMEDVYRRRKKNHEFAGYTFVSLVPVFAMPLLRSWGMEFAPELADFYTGAGRILELLALLVTWGIYRFIKNAKELRVLTAQENEGGSHRKPRVLEQMTGRFERQRNDVSTRIRELLLLSGAKETYGEFMMKTVLYAVLSAGAFAVFVALLYGGEGLFWWVVFGCAGSILAGLFAGSIPIIGLFYRKSLLFKEAEYEIRQFQAVILMERKLSMITITELLEDMEIFSRLFKRQLRECINSYAAGPKQALKVLKREGKKVHAEFEELAEGFLAVDGVGIKKAFAEVGNNRAMLEKLSRLEAEIQIEQKKDSMELLSKIPMALTVGGYFIVPFLIVSLRGVSAVFEMLNEMQMQP